MAGADKALLSINGEPCLARLVRRLAPQCDGLILNANGDVSRFQAFGLPVVQDDVLGFAGPLAGLLVGLDHIAMTRPDVGFAVSAPVDTPFAPQDLAVRLSRARDTAQAEIAVAASGARTHHTVALWPVELRHALRKAICDEGLRRVSGFIERFSTVVVEWPTTPYDPFFNINRPEDLARAEEIVASEAGGV